MTSFVSIEKQLQSYANEEKRKTAMWFFKTGPGQYGEGDIFIGVTTPEIRSIVKSVYTQIPLSEIEKLLTSHIHEYRMCGLLILTEKAARANDVELAMLVEYYLDHTKYVNNWDLVDSSAYKILGRYVTNHPEKRKILYTLSDSKNMWEQRIAIIATLWLIRSHEYSDILALSEKLLMHPHDLMQKAVGWMLREVGNRDQEILEEFLRKHYTQMPRTMLRYAIEKFEEPKRQTYLNGTV